MGNQVAIVTDSSAYIPKELITKYNIGVVPNVLIWGEETYDDGIDIQPDEFYTRLESADVMPSTSQVSIPSFQQIFTKFAGQGYDILAILISNELSKTINSAMQAREMVEGTRIEIVDSQSIAMSLGFMVLEAAKMAEQGASLDDCKAIVERARDGKHTGLVFSPDTLEFLHRGGRIGGGSRFLGTALQLKPILELVDGRVDAVERVRTRSKALARLIELTEERIAGRTPVKLASIEAHAPETAKQLLESAKEKISAEEIVVSEIGPVVGAHAGPGTVGLAFIAGI